MSEFKVYNGFGIKPTKSYSAAGWDFYVPNIQTDEQKQTALEALQKSYNVSKSRMQTLLGRMHEKLSQQGKEDEFKKNDVNLLHLLLSIDGSVMRTSQNKVNTFIEHYLVWSEDGRPGIRLHCNDHILINSGIKTVLDHDVAGVFFNKSGRGNKGFDVRACVVDEDYTGYVHLSNAYTKDNIDDGIVYCGDKLSQMLLLPIVHKDVCTEVDGKEYERLTKDSKRGADGFGSTDNVK